MGIAFARIINRLNLSQLLIPNTFHFVKQR